MAGSTWSSCQWELAELNGLTPVCAFGDHFEGTVAAPIAIADKVVISESARVRV